MTWRIDSPGSLYDANEGSVVYFDPGSGDTHLISDFAAFVIAQLCKQPMTTGELVTRIEPQTDARDSQELADAVTGVLEQLVTLDIVQRV